MVNTLLTFLVGVIAGFFGSTVGGGSLLSIPFLIFLGLPPQVAIATDRFGGLGQAITALFKFWKSKKIVWKFVPILAVTSLVGALVGANLLLNIDTQSLQKVVGILLFVLLGFVLFKREVGEKRQNTSFLKLLIGCLIYLAIQTFTGFFGAGTGILVFYTLMIFFGLTITESVATQITPLLFLLVPSILLFASHHLIQYEVGLVLMAGTAVGGYVGAHFAISKGMKWIKPLFVLVVIISSIKLLFF